MLDVGHVLFMASVENNDLSFHNRADREVSRCGFKTRPGSGTANCGRLESDQGLTHEEALE